MLDSYLVPVLVDVNYTHTHTHTHVSGYSLPPPLVITVINRALKLSNIVASYVGGRRPPNSNNYMIERVPPRQVSQRTHGTVTGTRDTTQKSSITECSAKSTVMMSDNKV